MALPVRPACAEDVTDANNDRKVKISPYLFGPGDRMTADTHVNVEGTAKAAYRVDANVACEVGLPKSGSNKVEISADGRNFAAIACRADGTTLAVRLSEGGLAVGVAILKLLKRSGAL